MATQRPGFAISFPELAAALLSQSEVMPRARLIAQQLSVYFPESAVVVYLLDPEQGWLPKATEGEVAFAEATIPADSGTLGIALERNGPVLFAGTDLPREEYAHLNIRRTVVSLAGIPFMVDDTMVGAAEVISFKQRIEESSLAGLGEFTKLAALGLAAGSAYETERNNQLESLTRITQMYDLEKVFNSNLEMADLLKMITSKFQEIMRVQAVNLWMVDGDGVTLMSQAGADPTSELGAVQVKGQGIAGDLSDSGEPVVVDDPNDPRLSSRNQGVEEGAVFTLVAAPVMDRQALVGVVEAINPLDGRSFDEDDQFLLSTMCETASNALHNASLLQAERKLEILQTLVSVSQEITSTLDMQRVLHSIVDRPTAVIAYERAAIATEQRGRLRLGAISGVPEVDVAEPTIKALEETLQWVSGLNEEILISQHGETIEGEREETVARFQKYFALTGSRCFYALPLVDDQGRLGILSFESSDPDFLTSAQTEMLKVLASQATVALRNAQMYKEVPFIGILEPVMDRKRKFLAMDKSRRRMWAALAAAVALFLLVVPLPMRVSGAALVAPARRAQIVPEIEGVVSKVYVREGQLVKAGQVLADLDDWEFRAAVAAANARHENAVSQMNRALAANDGTEAGLQRIQANLWAAELQRAQDRLDRTHLRSPIAGAVATPQVENLVGRRLQFGDAFAEIVDSTNAVVDVEVEESDLPLLKAGEPAGVKVESFPTRTFRGNVTILSPQSVARGSERVFFARVSVPNPDGSLRSGMQGRGKISAGWHRAGYVLLRGPAAWIYSKVWSWFGW